MKLIKLSDFSQLEESLSAKINRPAYRQAGCFVVPPRKDTLILAEICGKSKKCCCLCLDLKFNKKTKTRSILRCFLLLTLK
jgi:hypothetical protein